MCRLGDSRIPLLIAAGILLCVGVQMSIHRYLHHESHPHKTKPWDVLAAPGSGSPGRPERKLPAGWKETIDPNTRLPYFYNENVRARPPQTPMRLSLAREAAVTVDEHHFARTTSDSHGHPEPARTRTKRQDGPRHK